MVFSMAILVILVLLILAALAFRGTKSRRPGRDEAFHRAERDAHGRNTELSVDAILERHALPRLHEVWVQNRQGRSTEIDHLALCGAVILIVETKGWRGVVRVEAGGEQWIQVKARQTKLHPSPVAQNTRHSKLLRAKYLGAAFKPVVVVPYATFEGPQPDQVWSVEQLEAFIAEARAQRPDGGTSKVWETLCSIDKGQNKAVLRSEHMSRYSRDA